jgi:hypothetical protein
MHDLEQDSRRHDKPLPPRVFEAKESRFEKGKPSFTKQAIRRAWRMIQPVRNVADGT